MYICVCVCVCVRVCLCAHVSVCEDGDHIDCVLRITHQGRTPI